MSADAAATDAWVTAIRPELDLRRLPRAYRIAAAITLASAFCALAILRFGIGERTAGLVPLLVALAVGIVLDACSRVLPDALTLTSLSYALLLGTLEGRPLPAIVGALTAGAVVLVAALVTGGAFGGGDIKLVAALGATLGWDAGLVAVAASQLVGGTIAAALLVTGNARRQTPLPIGAVIALVGALLLLGRP